MIVVTLTSCPPALRGDLTAWLQEIDTGVFVGNVSARVRDELWERICRHAIHGRAAMVFSTRSEQHMDFRVHNTAWEPIDFDGLKLMLHPSVQRLAEKTLPPTLPLGFSNAAKAQKARQFAGLRQSALQMPRHYLALDFETTGLLPLQDKIIEMGALQVKEGEVIGSFQSLIRIDSSVPVSITALTGISDRMLRSEGRPLFDVLKEFLAFTGNLPLVSHQVSFDLSFLRSACKQCGVAMPTNPCTDTYALSRRLITDAPDWRLKSLAEHLDIRIENSHRSLADCYTIKHLYDKLIEIVESLD
jgi:CRISPR-associated protein Cas2